MINFIIYDCDKQRKMLFSRIIKTFMFKASDSYKIYEFDENNRDVIKSIKHLEGAKIFIISIDSKWAESLNIARKIREYNDFSSPIILVSKNNRTDLIEHLQNILFLDIIVEEENLTTKLLNDLKNAFKIINSRAVYPLNIYDEIYRIPYDDINYIIKNINDDSVTIHTKDDTYTEYITVKKLEKILEKDPRFFKSHRSCIINVYNVSLYDRKNNTISFYNGDVINTISRQNKRILATRLIEDVNVKIDT